MKKYGLLLTLILCVVVGGVYATWTYAQETTVPEVANVNVELAKSVSNNPKGTLQIGKNTLKIVVDDAGGYNAGVTVEGELKFTFIAATGADTATASGIALKYALAGPVDCKYSNEDVFTVTTGEQLYDSGNVTLSGTITAANIQALIDINGTITLDTAEKYTSFAQAIGNPVFTLTISEYVAP